MAKQIMDKKEMALKLGAVVYQQGQLGGSICINESGNVLLFVDQKLVVIIEPRVVTVLEEGDLERLKAE